MKEYTPFLELFFRTIQNQLVIFQGEMINEQYRTEFSEKLHLVSNNCIIPNTIRLFECNGQVYLTYYWLSSLKDEYGRKIGNTPIFGVSCSKKTFKRNPDMLALSLQNMFNSIVEELSITNTDDGYEASNYFFDLFDDMSKLEHPLKKILFNYYYSDNKLVNKKLLDFVRKQKLSLFSDVDVAQSITLKPSMQKSNDVKKR